MEVTMALKKSLILFPLLALMLLGPRCSLSQETPAQRFMRQHIVGAVPPSTDTTYCDDMMLRRHINEYSCKESNSFVHTAPLSATAVCRERLTACRNGIVNCHKSVSAMYVTKCNLRGGSRYPNCEYRNNLVRAHIVVLCNDQTPPLPVHLDHLVYGPPQ
uniref:Ribonuclease A C3 n=1 Tax=Sorex araneus TaxID=42254 RepID=W0UVB0_SORAR|nr:TPA: ribonuclease A C3 [Sorex araneus]